MIDRERLIERFLRYAVIDSESGHERAMAQTVMTELAALENLHCQISMDDSGSQWGSDSGNIYAWIPGTVEAEPLMFCAHLDTVAPGKGIEPERQQGRIVSRGNTILAADDKSGVAAIMEALTRLNEEDLSYGPVEIFFSTGEEIGSMGARHADFSRFRSKCAVTADSVGSPGIMPIRAPGQTKVRARILGRPAHAGIEPEKGVSAIMAAAEAVTRMNLLRIDSETTANIGTFKAIGATNIVAPEAELEIEIRSHNPQKLDAQTAQILQAIENAAHDAGARAECLENCLYRPFALADDNSYVQMAVQACRRHDIPVKLCGSGGCSDANLLNQAGITAFNIGTGMTLPHSIDESLDLEEFHDAAEVILTLMRREIH